MFDAILYKDRELTVQWKRNNLQSTIKTATYTCLSCSMPEWYLLFSLTRKRAGTTIQTMATTGECPSVGTPSRIRQQVLVGRFGRQSAKKPGKLHVKSHQAELCLAPVQQRSLSPLIARCGAYTAHDRFISRPLITSSRCDDFDEYEMTDALA